MLPRPRAYVDWTVPVDDAGKEIGECCDEASYRFYLEWLADYLHRVDIPVPESQAALLACYRSRGGAGHAVFDLSECLGCDIGASEDISVASGNGEPFPEYHARELKFLSEFYGAGQEEEMADLITTESDYLRLGAEFRECQEKVPAHITHADIPYRAILAALFKDVPDFQERHRHLDYFYSNFNDLASK